MSDPGVTASGPSRRQKRMGPAPFASFEDLSDELESPEEKQAAGSVVRLPGIREDITPSTPAHQEQSSASFTYTGISLVGLTVPPSPPSNVVSSTSPLQSSNKLSLQTPNTPRIDISRASSSSHHEDSRDSSPERELFEGRDPSSAKLGLGFREEGTLDLRSSTEELDFQDPQAKIKGRTRPQSPCLQDDSTLGHNRKDSQSSDIVLLSISGRTSRLSSIGSQGSAHSRISNASHLSVMSGQSGASRSPSPHKMLLETSFCGAKPPKTSQAQSEQPGTKVESEVLEKVLLSRKHDPTEAILAECISLEPKQRPKSCKQAPEKPIRKSDKSIQSVKSDITITVDKPPKSDSNNAEKLPRTFVSASGVEYTYIPLKGPLPPPVATVNTRPKSREVKSASVHTNSSANATKDKSNISGKPKAKSATPSPVAHKKDETPKYIRIRLKPDHLYDDEDLSSSAQMQKPFSLNLNDANKKASQSFAEIMQKETSRIEQLGCPQKPTDPVGQGKSLSSTPNASPKLSRHGFLKEIGSKTPSPSLSRKSSFCSLFKSKETIASPDSPTVANSRRKSTLTGVLREASDSIRDRSRSRSKSRDRDKSHAISVAPSSTESIDSKSKQKSVFSIFKPRKADKSKAEADNNSSPEILPSLDGIANVEFKFNSDSNVPSSKGHQSRSGRKFNENPLEGDSIRIPLHSPTHSETWNTLQDLKTSSQDSQDTVIEVTSRNVDAIIEQIPPNVESNFSNVPCSKIEKNERQSSTSSENIIFSTKLGNNDEIFSTKLPKKKNIEEKIATQVKDVLHNKTELENSQAICKLEETVPRLAKNASNIHISNSVSEEINIESKTGITIKNETKLSMKLKTETPKIHVENKENRHSTVSSIVDDDHNSSESERDSELDFLKNKVDFTLKLEEAMSDVVEPERKGLVFQQDSYDEELPYVPTTLPLERSVAIPIVPIKQRSTFEMKTCPIERPRSTTPINPSCLEEYCEEVIGSVNPENITKTIEKLKIYLPKDDSTEKHVKLKSPRKNTSTTNWAAFAETGMSMQRRPSLPQEETTPPPLPPKGVQKEWINFEEIPERRKPPKRIQTIPSRGAIDVPESILQENVVYSYVNPEDCKCECHEINARERERHLREDEPIQIREDEMPLLEDELGDDEKSAEANARAKRDVAIPEQKDRNRKSSTDRGVNETNGLQQSRCTPFTCDLGITSNRSNVISQNDPQSSSSDSPHAFSKHPNLL